MDQTEKRIAEIRERESKATPGEWIAMDTDLVRKIFNGCPVIVTSEIEDAIVASIGMDMEHWDGNQDFIARARQDIPWLCDQLTAAQERVKELEAALVLCKAELRYYPGDSNREGDALINTAHTAAEDALKK